MKSKTAVVTLSILSDPNNAGWIAAGLPSKRAYAREIGAVSRSRDHSWAGSVAMGRRTNNGSLLDVYDCVIYLDADLAIYLKAPNLFDVVPEDHWGCFDEGWTEGAGKRHALFAWLKEGWPDDPCDLYANNGVFICSREHQWLFDYRTLNRKLNTYEQTCMSRRIWEALQAQPPRIECIG